MGILEIGTIIAFAVLFLHYTSWNGEINEWVKRYIKPKGMLYKPIYGCCVCMTPYYGTIIYLLVTKFILVNFILTLLVASGISVIFVCLIGIRDYFMEALKKLEKENGKSI